ncbi:hypothetical protein NLG97_g9079 [Lecanicillium saksenae]|uniref:Uncharacterized protein n=1 Tax=Lecanicillium saksenae TaxID=468837 RepID=A0ACC1QJR1_9HYPO|nr:hypothetical protein NLG97_g9079 [Lecanicillium saksenae]
MKAAVILALATSALATDWEYWSGPSCTGSLISNGTWPCGTVVLPRDRPIRSIRLLYENGHGTFLHTSRDTTGIPWRWNGQPGSCVDDPNQLTGSVYVTC